MFLTQQLKSSGAKACESKQKLSPMQMAKESGSYRLLLNVSQVF
jgi:hypothetical protein